MTGFVGDYKAKIDSKGRLVFPATLKRQLLSENSDKFIIKKDIYEKCLIIYTTQEWERQNSILRAKLNPYDRKHKIFLREYYRSSYEIYLDNNNRILIPSELIEYAEINKEVVFSGQDMKIELWAKQNYQANEMQADEFAKLAEEIMGIGF